MSFPNITDIANQASDRASDWANAAGIWASGASDQAGQKAREWLTTSLPPGASKACLKTVSEAAKHLFTCVGQFPNHLGDQIQQRCYCWFDMTREMEEAECEAFIHNVSSGHTDVQSQYGTISFNQGEDMRVECEPYHEMWLKEHPEPTILQLLWDRTCLFFEKHPGVLWFLILLLLLVLALLLLKYLRRTKFGRDLIKSFSAATAQLCEACSGDYDQCVEDHPECCKNQVGASNSGDVYDASEQAFSKRTFALEDAPQQAKRSLKVYPDDRDLEAEAYAQAAYSYSGKSTLESRTQKAQRSQKVYADDSELEEEAEPQGLAYLISGVASLFGPAEEEKEERLPPELHYYMVQEGRSLAEIHQERQAEADTSTQPLLGAASASTMYPATSQQFHNPPYQNIHSSSADGHHITSANPQVLQQSAMRQPMASWQSDAAIPFPHGKTYGAPPPQGRSYTGRR